MGVEGIGARVARKEDKRFLMGQGRYTDDMSVPGMRYAAFVRSPHAHARIKGIDTSAAEDMPGVIAVLNGKQMLDDGIGNLICGWMIHSKDGSPMKMGAWRPIAHDSVRYVGDRFTQVSDQEDNPRTVSLFNIGAPTVSTLSFPLELPDYQVVNLRGGIRYGAFEAAIFVQNVTDERAWLSVDRERGLRARYGYQTNQPRTVGVTIRKSF